MNRILNRLIKKYLSSHGDDRKVMSFVKEVKKVSVQQEEHRQMIVRTLKISSEELNEINFSLKENLSKNKVDNQKLEKIIAKQNALFDASNEAIFSFNNNNEIDKVNQAGIDFLDLPDDILNSGNVTCEYFMRKISDREEFSYDISILKEDKLEIVQGFFESIDNKYYEFYSVPEVIEGERIGRVWCCRDITTIRKNEELLKYQVNHDTLTNLPNRLMLLESLEHAVNMSKRHGNKVAVLFIDLDDFKKINDTAGHQEGDRYLIEFSDKIKSGLRDGDILGRLGGDEFLVILEDINDYNDIIKVTNKILNICNNPFYVNDKQYFISCSIGVCVSPDDSSISEQLIRKADMAMYQAKKSGKNKYHFFDKKLEKIAFNRVLIESQLRDAIKHNDFVLHYQPKINLFDNKICGVEALIRWKKNTGVIVYPDSFISIAEEAGLIRDITYWLIKEACRNINDWKGTVLDGVPISLNISAVDFSDSCFIKNAFDIIEESGVDPELLEFELTESLLFNNIAEAQENIAKLKSKKIKISIDDFGTGFSSFSYLLDMEIDYLKIDKSFVIGAHNDKKAKAIVKSIIDIGTNLGLQVIGEGIESINEMNLLKEEGCHIGQGYHMSKPIPEDDLLIYASK
jgi:diguanylate cyclase (GGDEF)-like protein